MSIIKLTAFISAVFCKCKSAACKKYFCGRKGRSILKNKKGISPAMRVSFVSVAVNIMLSLLKLVCGAAARSQAMVSDAVHSFSDVASTVIVIIGLKISERAPDTKCQYGYERAECSASIILSGVLFATGALLGYSSLSVIISGEYAKQEAPGVLALAAAVISVIVKEWMYRYTMHTAKRIGSTALAADAWHHRSDSLSSVGSFAGILGARLGIKALDPAAGFIICLFIIKASYDIFRQSASRMTDRACDDETVVRIRQIIASVKGAERLGELKTRMFGSKIYVDAELVINGNLPLSDAYKISQEASKGVERALPKVKKCNVHIVPDKNIE